jgi:hypothetical protein
MIVTILAGIPVLGWCQAQIFALLGCCTPARHGLTPEPSYRLEQTLAICRDMID